jgi:succinate dehydrogenase/fumarate reductase flavoprotein subunit
MSMNRRQFLEGAGAVAAVAATSAAVASTAVADTADDLMTADKNAEVKWSFEVAPDPIPEDQISATYTHDIVIVGAGMAGVCCAVAAAEDGADVILFSASSRAISRGGSNHAIGSRYQAEMGIEYDPQLARKIVKAEQTAGTYFMDKKKWSRWITHSAESINWTIDLMEAKGLHCSLEPGFPDPDGVIEVPAASHNFWSDEVPFGALFGAPLEAQTYAQIFTEDLGGEIHYNTKALYLVRDDDNTGRVSAVVAQDADGNYVKYEANKAVVLATGDFSKDRDLMARYCPFAYDIFKDDITWDNINYDTELAYDGLMPGDGQKMGLWVGAAWQKVQPCAPMINGGASGPAHGVISNFWGINLDIHGERYMNEVTNFAYGAMAKLMLPERTAFAVWDTAYAYTQDEWESFGCSVGRENGIMPSTPEDLIAGWDQNAEAGVVEGIGSTTIYYKADTLEELVDQMEGIDKEAALESIKRYNEYAEAGVDEEFQVNPEVLYPISTPPFYATKSVGATFLTVCGGLRTDEKMRVCDENDQPIEGLYNTGIMTGDFYANSYNFVMPGQNLGAVCGTLSYLLGKDLAQL